MASVLMASVWFCYAPAGRAGDDANSKPQEAAPSGAPGKLVVTVGKSLIIDSPMKIQRISVSNGELIEAVGQVFVAPFKSEKAWPQSQRSVPGGFSSLQFGHSIILAPHLH